MPAKDHDLQSFLEAALGIPSTVRIDTLGPSVLGKSYCVFNDQQRLFVKQAPRKQIRTLEMERKGLQAIAQTATLRVPEIIGYGESGQHAFLALEFIELQAHSPKSLAQMGSQLARMHLTRTPWSYGFEADNSLGASPQPNAWSKDWVAFFKQRRLGFQIARIEEKYGDSELCQAAWELTGRIERFFDEVELRPSLLHGDLWRGNSARLSDHSPVVYDPACYFGHHEAELSIMQMFGGYGPEFYTAYHALIPKQAGFDKRQLLYQLYHYLNHYFLFGISYRQPCDEIIRSLS